MKDAANQRQRISTHYIIIIIISSSSSSSSTVIGKIYVPNASTQFNTDLFAIFHVSLTYSFEMQINETSYKQKKSLLELIHSVSGLKRVTEQIDRQAISHQHVFILHTKTSNNRPDAPLIVRVLPRVTTTLYPFRFCLQPLRATACAGNCTLKNLLCT